MKISIKHKLLLASPFIMAASWLHAETVDYKKQLNAISGQNYEVKSVKNSALKGIKEIIVANGPARQVVYMSDDGEFLFDGNLVNTKAKQNLTELAKKTMRHDLMTEFKKTHKGIDFLPEKMTDLITVFTDIDCGVCRKFHENVESFNEAGIGVSYLFFPRAGIGSNSHQKATNVWCATDQQNALTQAKSGVELTPLMCPNPIESQFNLGISAGVIGTPYIVLADGTLIPGYQTLNQLKQRLAESKAKK